MATGWENSKLGLQEIEQTLKRPLGPQSEQCLWPLTGGAGNGQNSSAIEITMKLINFGQE